MIQQIRENIMAREVDKRILEEMFIQLLAEKANIIKDHHQNSLSLLMILANIGPTMATFKFYDFREENSLRLHITLSNLGDIDITNSPIVATSELFASTILFSMWMSLY